MKKILLFLLAVLISTSVFPQESATREIRLCDANTVGTGLPIDVTKEKSEVSLRYQADVSVPVFVGDRLTRMVFTGYNPGNEMVRHFTVQVSTDLSGKRFTTVYDADCTIPHGGSADACIPLIVLDFPSPLEVETRLRLNVKMACSGEAVEIPVYFEQYAAGTTTLPTLLLTLQSDVAYYEGTITTQDGTPVQGATATVHNSMLSFDAVSGEDGKVSVRVDDDNAPYYLTVTAAGFPDYKTGSFYFKEISNHSWNAGTVPGDIVLPDRLDFTAGRMATIVLPQAPNPSWGRYYRLDRNEGRDIIFEREEEPKAGTPYVIFPDEDFSVNMSEYSLSKTDDPEPVPFPDNAYDAHTGFQGSYKSQPVRTDLYDGEYIYLLDSTPDCKDESARQKRIGACRAYLVLGVYSPEMRYEGPRYVFVGEQTGVNEVSVGAAAGYFYSLQGYRMSAMPKRGLYIRNGRKCVAK